MEPPETKIAYAVDAKILTVDKDNSGEWYFETLNNRFWTWMTRPPFSPGDTVRITIQKVTGDGQAR